MSRFRLPLRLFVEKPTNHQLKRIPRFVHEVPLHLVDYTTNCGPMQSAHQDTFHPILCRQASNNDNFMSNNFLINSMSFEFSTGYMLTLFTTTHPSVRFDIHETTVRSIHEIAFPFRERENDPVSQAFDTFAQHRNLIINFNNGAKKTFGCRFVMRLQINNSEIDSTANADPLKLLRTL